MFNKKQTKQKQKQKTKTRHQRFYINMKIENFVHKWDPQRLLQLLTWLHISDYSNFWSMKDESLLIHSLALFKCFTYRNLFQNGANGVKKMVKLVNEFLSKTQNFGHISDHPNISNFTSLWYKY